MPRALMIVTGLLMYAGCAVPPTPDPVSRSGDPGAPVVAPEVTETLSLADVERISPRARAAEFVHPHEEEEPHHPHHPHHHDEPHHEHHEHQGHPDHPQGHDQEGGQDDR